jgi:hypothetical protein
MPFYPDFVGLGFSSVENQSNHTVGKIEVFWSRSDSSKVLTAPDCKVLAATNPIQHHRTVKCREYA